MLRLDKIVVGAKVCGLAGPVAVEVVRVEWIGSDALNVVYRGEHGLAEVLVYRDAELRLDLTQASRAFSFDGDGEAFKIASEAQRIRLAHLFDPYLAVHSDLPLKAGTGLLQNVIRGGTRPRRPSASGRLTKIIMWDKLWAESTCLRNISIKSRD